MLTIFLGEVTFWIYFICSLFPQYAIVLIGEIFVLTCGKNPAQETSYIPTWLLTQTVTGMLLSQLNHSWSFWRVSASGSCPKFLLWFLHLASAAQAVCRSTVDSALHCISSALFQYLSYLLFLQIPYLVMISP